MARAAVSTRRAAPALLAMLAACGATARDDSAFGGAASVWRDRAYQTESASQRLDVYVPRNSVDHPPLVVLVHGGGWMDLSKDNVLLWAATFLRAGWAVANVEYRRGREAPAPAAARDVRCAIKWVARHAGEYGADQSRLVVAGESAGAHLVLLAAFADSSADLDAHCPGPMPPIAGVINRMGIVDVNDLLAGANWRGWATGWIGNSPGAEERARQLSPITWIRPGLPPVLTVHGDRDGTVPFAQAQRLQDALERNGVPHEFVVLRGADHGPLAPEPAGVTEAAIARFLAQIASRD